MIKELLSKGLKYSLANPEEFATAYKEAFGEKVCSYCPGIIQEKFNKLLKTDEQKIIIMKSRKWNMIPGKLIDTLMSQSGPCGQYTNDNITDEVAEQLITKGYSSYFVKNNTIEIEEIEPDPVIEEAPVAFEVIEKSEPATEVKKETKDSFDTYSRKRLIEYCESKGYNVKEYGELVRKQLIEYVRTK